MTQQQTSQKKVFVRISSLILLGYAILALAFFFVIGNQMLDGESSIQFFADSRTYELAALELKDLSPFELVRYNPNYFGPITILNLLQGNRWCVLIFNIVIFAASARLIMAAIPVNRKFFAILLALNPMTFSSLLSVNKEILSVLTVALLIYGTERKKLGSLLASVAVSFLVRWQLAVFVIAILGLLSPFNPFRRRRFLAFMGMLLAISVAYAIGVNSVFAHVNDVAEVGSENWDGSGLWGRLLDIQNAGGYFLVFVPKTLHAMFAILRYIGQLFDPPEGEFYNYVVVMLHSLVTLLVLAWGAFTRKLTLQNNVLYFALIYLLLFGLTPIYAPRYFYPVFVFLCIVAAQEVYKKKNLSSSPTWQYAYE